MSGAHRDHLDPGDTTRFVGREVPCALTHARSTALVGPRMPVCALRPEVAAALAAKVDRLREPRADKRFHSVARDRTRSTQAAT